MTGSHEVGKRSVVRRRKRIRGAGRDALGLIRQVEDPVGLVTTFDYDAVGQRIATRDPAGNVTSQSYDPTGNPIGRVDPLGSMTTTTYDGVGRVRAIENALGFITTYNYDGGGRLGSVQDPLGDLTTVSYDSYSRPLDIRYPDGAVVTNVWGVTGINSDGSLQWGLYSAVDPLGQRTSFAYTVRGEVWAVQDELGGINYHLYDAAGNPTRFVDALDHATTLQYDYGNRPTTLINANGHATRTIYDLAGRPVQVVDPLGHTTRTLYDGANQPIAVENALGQITSTLYDLAGRTVAVMDPLGHITSTIYDYTYQTVTQTAGQVTTLTHWQYRIARVDANGHAVTTLYNGLWQPVAVTDALGNSVQTRYDALGRPIALVDARGQITTTEYDAVGRVLARTDPLGNLLSYTYDRSSFRALGFDGRGQVIERPATLHHPDTRLDARGRLTTYALDFLNRPIETLYSDGGLVTRTYDGLGRVTTLLDGAGSTRTDYDLLGRVLEVSLPTGQALTYQYDGMGNRRWMQDPGGGFTSYTWDANERLTEILNPYGETTAIEYDSIGREWRKTLDNGMVVSHAYDPAGRETVLQYLKSDGTPITLYTATYDNVGNRLTVEELGGVGLGFAYDWADQLTHEWRTGADAYDVSYTYDAAGNRLVENDGGSLTTYTYDEANELLVAVKPDATRVTHTWDANGNLWVEDDGGQVTTYTWDDDNHLVRVEKPDATVEEYAYDANGLRRKKETTEGTILFVRDGQNVFVETDESLVVQAQYTLAPEEWGELLSQRRGDDSHFYGFDLQSSTRVLVSVGGVVTDSESFRAFGERVAASGSTVHPFRYAGEVDYYADAEDLLNAGVRVLKPSLGRWLSPDPLWPEGGANAYLYVGNKPLRYVDPSGEQTEPLPVAVRVTPSGRSIGIDPYGRVMTASPGRGWVDIGANPDFPPATPLRPQPQFQTSYDYDYWNEVRKAALTEEEFIALLDALSYVPGLSTPASVVLMLAKVAQGDYRGAALEAVGLVPVGKILKRAAKAAKPGLQAATPIASQQTQEHIKRIREWAAEIRRSLPMRQVLTTIAKRPAQIMKPKPGRMHHPYLKKAERTIQRKGVNWIYEAIEAAMTMKVTKPGRVVFELRVGSKGLRPFEARAVHRLGHMTDDELVVMAAQDHGPRVAGKPGWTINLHHLDQHGVRSPKGPFIEIEQPPKGTPPRHYWGNTVQHKPTSVPLGGKGREEFDKQIQPRYWRMMAANELLRRCETDPRCVLKGLGFIL